jgi:flagellar hook-length control protein FliK
MFAGQGMDLGNVDVGQHGFAQGQDREAAEQLDGQMAGQGSEADIESVDESETQERLSGQGMVDYYI